MCVYSPDLGILSAAADKISNPTCIGEKMNEFSCDFPR